MTVFESEAKMAASILDVVNFFRFFSSGLYAPNPAVWRSCNSTIKDPFERQNGSSVGPIVSEKAHFGDFASRLTPIFPIVNACPLVGCFRPVFFWAWVLAGILRRKTLEEWFAEPDLTCP